MPIMGDRRVIIIPARWDSSRMPGKPMCPLQGQDGRMKPLIEWTWEAARRCTQATEVWVATDSLVILDHINKLGGNAVLTPVHCHNGTERCMFAAQTLDLDDEDIVLNLQGDCPLVPAASLDRLMRRQRFSSFVTSTLLAPFDPSVNDPGRVVAVTEPDSMAITHFARNVTLFPRKTRAPAMGIYSHMGVYAYRMWALQEYGRMLPTADEQEVNLEQVRFIENDIQMLGVMSTLEHPVPEVNYPADVHQVEKELG